MSAFRNCVTERGLLPDRFWVVSCEWRGGHDRRLFHLENIHLTEKAARADWERLTPEAHNESHCKPRDFDAGFLRHEIREYRIAKGDAA